MAARTVVQAAVAAKGRAATARATGLDRERDWWGIDLAVRPKREPSAVECGRSWIHFVRFFISCYLFIFNSIIY